MSGQRDNRKQQVALNHNDHFDVPVRTLYIAPVTPFMSGSIRAYFQRFGPVENVRVHSKDVDFHYGFVQFKRAESAKKALSKPKHRINNCIVKVKEANKQHQAGYKLNEDTANNNNMSTSSKDPLFAPINQESTILKTLDDDCLKEIFKHLHLHDLCAAAQVCVRFNQNAQEHFKLHHTRLNIVELCTQNNIDYQISLSLVEDLLRNFGKFLTSLVLVHSVFDEDDCDKMLKMLNKYCAGTLKCLIMYGFEINRPLTYSLRPLFGKLVKLIWYDFVGTNKLRNLLAECYELKSLRIGNCLINSGHWMKQTFLSLEELEMDSVYDLSTKTLDQMLQMNTHLKKLMISQVDLPSSVLQIISHRLPNLQQLYFNANFEHSGETDAVISKNMLHLSNLKSLKSLKFNCDAFSEECSGLKTLIDHFLQQNAALETFGMLGGRIDKELVEKLSKLSNTTKLHLISTKMHQLKLMDLAKQLPHLTELRLQNVQGINTNEIQKMLPIAENLNILDIISLNSDVKINTETYHTILNVIKSRGNNTKLTLNMICNRSQVTVPQSSIQRNRYWLDIKEICMNLDIDSDSESESEDDSFEVYGVWFDTDDDDSDNNASDIDMDIDDDDDDSGDEQEQEEEDEDGLQDEALRAMILFIIGHRF